MEQLVMWKKKCGRVGGGQERQKKMYMEIKFDSHES